MKLEQPVVLQREDLLSLGDRYQDLLFNYATVLDQYHDSLKGCAGLLGFGLLLNLVACAASVLSFQPTPLPVALKYMLVAGASMSLIYGILWCRHFNGFRVWQRWQQVKGVRALFFEQRMDISALSAADIWKGVMQDEHDRRALAAKLRGLRASK